MLSALFFVVRLQYSIVLRYGISIGNCFLNVYAYGFRWSRHSRSKNDDQWGFTFSLVSRVSFAPNLSIFQDEFHFPFNVQFLDTTYGVPWFKKMWILSHSQNQQRKRTRSPMCSSILWIRHEHECTLETKKNRVVRFEYLLKCLAIRFDGLESGAELYCATLGEFEWQPMFSRYVQSCDHVFGSFIFIFESSHEDKDKEPNEEVGDVHFLDREDTGWSCFLETGWRLKEFAQWETVVEPGGVVGVVCGDVGNGMALISLVSVVVVGISFRYRYGYDHEMDSIRT